MTCPAGKEYRVHQVYPVHQDLMVRMEMMDKMDIEDHRVLPVHEDHQDHQDNKEHLVLMDLLAKRVTKVSVTIAHCHVLNQVTHNNYCTFLLSPYSQFQFYFKISVILYILLYAQKFFNFLYFSNFEYMYIKITNLLTNLHNFYE
ncbi:unnamed protein product [Wuchereria bancrofti]|uniref:Uncharacterized protein n=1 Tax=Wuchereria bancrofti TaxID=6293 RepID=A0A3P7FMY0_WUCBA|nr:unnamed protein product [Wuchereria bancrofti]